MEVKGTQVGGSSGSKKSSSTSKTSISKDLGTESARKELVGVKKNNASNNSRGTSSSSSSSSSSSAAEQKKQENQKQIEQYSKLRRESAEIQAQLTVIEVELQNAKEKLQTVQTGKKADELKKQIQDAQDMINEIKNNLKVTNEKAADKIKELGGIPSGFDIGEKVIEQAYKKTAGGAYSCDTDALKTINTMLNTTLTKLNQAETSAANLPNLEGCETVKNASTRINNVKNDISKTSKNMQDEIEYVEKIEKDNERIMANALKDLNTDSLREELFGIKKENSLKEYKQQITKDLGNDSAKAEKFAEKKYEAQMKEVKSFAEQCGIDTAGKTRDELIIEIASVLGINLQNAETTTTHKDPYTPIFDQTKNKVRGAVCGPTSAAMLASFCSGKIFTPDEMMDLIPYFRSAYTPGIGTGDSAFWQKDSSEIWHQFNVEYYDNVIGEEPGGWYGEAGWKKLMDCLNSGGCAIMRTKNKLFTDGGHYLFVEGISEDGTKLIIRDPFGAKYTNRFKTIQRIFRKWIPNRVKSLT